MPPSGSEFSVVAYQDSDKSRWDAFVSSSKNSTFLFYRDYMDYHRDRFIDHSLIVCDGSEIVALLPANFSRDGTVVSHQGLTYGGLIVPHSATLCDVMRCLQAVLHYLERQQVQTLIYKRIPTFYNPLPDDEVDYAMFLLGARLSRRDCALVVPMADRLPLQTRRKRQIKKAAKAGLRVVQETDFAPFWERVLIPRLATRYGVRPVHTVGEITLLASRFPSQIKMFAAYAENSILAGTVIYETPWVAHAQYIAVTDPGQEVGALDFLFGSLLDEVYKGKRFFDFGICNEQEGRVLNQGLLEWKEGFGGRCYTHDFYEIATGSHTRLEAALPRPSASDKSETSDPS